MHSIQRMTCKQRDDASILKEKVFHGKISMNENRTGRLHSATLRRLMNKETTQKPSRQTILSKRKEIELVKFRVLLLGQEKSRKIALVRNKTQTSKTLYQENLEKSKFQLKLKWH